MSLKRYALIAATSLHHHHHHQQQQQQHQQQQQQQNTTLFMNATKSTPKIVTTSIEIFNEDDYNNSTIITTTDETTITPILAPAVVQPHFILNPVVSGTVSSETITGGGSGSGSEGTPSITTYYGGGLGVFHQQNTRASSTGSYFGASGTSLSGAGGTTVGGSGSYAHTINGNVNLLLGGAMLSLITTVLCVVCYCCHRNIKKRNEAEYRQQTQWLENDPNMEIYSVEQCYESAGMFLAESADGLATVPALSHEPPPSYDAVLAMQEQQQRQQQMLLRQHSPPPGYRSSLDLTINNNNTNNNNSLLLTSNAYRHTSHTQIGNNNNNLSNMDDLDAATSYNQNHQNQNHTVSNNNNGMLQWKFCTLNNNNNNNNHHSHHHNNNSSSSSQLAQAELMKKVLHAKSCCSLQRAEVESMWNAAAAAVAIRHNIQEDDLLHETCFTARKSLPSCSSNNTRGRATNNLTLCVLGQQQQQNSTYRRGCPLCGKFRYDETMSLSVSTESGLNDHIALEQLHENNNAEECACSQVDVSEDNCATTVRERYLNEDLENGNIILNEAAGGLPAAVALTSDCEIFINKTETDDRENNNNNNAAASTGMSSTSRENECEEGQQLNLISINENGIVRVDMSKIIDKTGLPTYEAALKLDSSGYV